MTPLIVILAGGEGSRMGGGKPLRLLGGRTLIDRAVERARGWSDEVRLALRSPDQAGETGVAALIDDPELWGPLSGLASGLSEARAIGRSHVLTLPCDAPFLPDDLVERLGTAAGEGTALASSGGQLHPVCGCWPVRTLDAIPAYAASGRRSLKGLAETVGFVAVDWPDRFFVNVNTPEQLAEAERRLASEV